MILRNIVLGALAGFIVSASGLYLTRDRSRDVLSSTKDSVVMVGHAGRWGGGTGFVVEAPSGRKFLVTNNHVCAGDGDVLITGSSLERPLPARVIERLPHFDLCLVEAPANLPALKVGRESRVGDMALVVGHPYLRTLTLTFGPVRQKSVSADFIIESDKCDGIGQSHKEVDTFIGPMTLCFQSIPADEILAASLPGNSGSPVLNLSGEVVGVVFAIDGAGTYIVPLANLQLLLSVY